MRLTALRVRAAPPLGPLDVDLGGGLVGIVCEDAMVRALLGTRIPLAALRAGAAIDPDGGRIEIETDPPLTPGETSLEWARLWGGLGLRTPHDVIDLGVELLAEDVRGDLMARLRRAGITDEGPRTRVHPRHFDAAPDPLPISERELRRLRADHAEAVGDLEVGSMDWLRERQDAETHLQAYRDRARELKARLTHLEESGPSADCPTCGRGLGEHHADVVAHLREEWETVVQDGSWWKRRRQQLEPKPPHVQKLEGRVLRLQAAVERAAENLERARARVEEGSGDDVRWVLDRVRGSGNGESGSPVHRGLQEALAVLRDDLVRRGERHLSAVSGGEFFALQEPGERVVAADGSLLLRSDATATATLACRLAVLEALEERGSAPDSLFLSASAGDAGPGWIRRALPSLRAWTRDRGGQVVLVGEAALAETPEAFDQLVEVLGASEDGRVRELPTSPSVLGSPT